MVNIRENDEDKKYINMIESKVNGLTTKSDVVRFSLMFTALILKDLKVGLTYEKEYN